MTAQPLTSSRFEFEDPSEAIEFYFSQGWTDGLPVVPPTLAKVRRFLECSGRSPSEIVGAEPTKGRVITVEKVAINAVMAGCLPEYFPVVLAAIEAMCEPEFNLHAITVSTGSAAILTVVNGPIAKTLGLNSGVSVFGSSHRANSTIGRAIRLVVSNVTGAVSGVLDKSTFGHTGKHTWCMAELEESDFWEPLHVERGFSGTQSTVTVFAALSPIQISNHDAHLPEPILTSLSDGMFAAGPAQGEILVLFSPEYLRSIRSAGWSKGRVKRFLFELSRRKTSDWARAGVIGISVEDHDLLVSVAKSPESIILIVAGGPAGSYADVIPIWGGGTNSRSVTKEIRTPS